MKKMLANAYTLDNAETTKAFYDDWAGSYDEEVSENGYVTPKRCAEALAEFVDDPSLPILDIGCGTGISGQALKEAGFATIDGCDFSAEMLARADQKGLYRNIFNTNLEDPFPFEAGIYANLAAIGVLNPGHAPASTLDAIMSLLDPGGLFVFSLNDHALEDKTYEARLNEHVDTGSAALLFREHGPHLPQIDLGSNVYVLKKL